MRSLERTRGVLAGRPVDHLPAQPVIMMLAAKNAGIRYIDYTKDGRKMAEAQLKMPARAVSTGMKIRGRR